MNNIRLEIKDKYITLYGSNAIIQKEKAIIENLGLTGDEYKDRLIIQKCIDDKKLKSDILYCGNTVYPFSKIVKAYRKLQKSDSLENLTKEMYNFFTNACGDIAHYDIGGFKAYYNYNFRQLESEILQNCWTPSWHSDVDRIFKELKIDRDYFHERELVNIDSISLNKLKNIIEDCGWKVTSNNDIFLKLERNITYGNSFSFDVNISSNKASNIINEIQNYTNSFDKNEYVEQAVKNRNDMENPPTIKEIVVFTDNIGSMLNKLNTDLIYKARIEAQEKHDTLDEIINNDDYDYDY